MLSGEIYEAWQRSAGEAVIFTEWSLKVQSGIYLTLHAHMCTKKFDFGK